MSDLTPEQIAERLIPLEREIRRRAFPPPRDPSEPLIIGNPPPVPNILASRVNAEVLARTFDSLREQLLKVTAERDGAMAKAQAIIFDMDQRNADRAEAAEQRALKAEADAVALREKCKAGLGGASALLFLKDGTPPLSPELTERAHREISVALAALKEPHPGALLLEAAEAMAEALKETRDRLGTSDIAAEWCHAALALWKKARGGG